MNTRTLLSCENTFVISERRRGRQRRRRGCGIPCIRIAGPQGIQLYCNSVNSLCFQLQGLDMADSLISQEISTCSMAGINPYIQM